MASSSRLDAVIALAKRRGFVFQAGEIYGGSRSAWDYGPLGVELKENIKRQWWRSMVTRRDDVVGLDSSVILPRRVWEASGHVDVFSDPLVECLNCHKRYRADHLEEEFEEKKGRAPEGGLAEVVCVNCGTRGQWTEPKEFSGLLKTYLGPVEPGSDEEWHQSWIDARMAWYTDLGINPENLRLYEHPAEKLSHYSKRTVDIEYRFGFSGSEFGELEGVANRTDFDLSTHAAASGVDLSYFDQGKNERWTPYVIEPAAGLTRSLMAFLVDAYAEDEAPNTKGGVDVRTVLRLDRRLAPVKAAVLPLSRNEKLSPVARELADTLRQHWNVDFDDAGAIGRRYRRQDEIGTPFAITVDFDTLDDQAVTVRERDTMQQERIPLAKLEGYLAAELLGA